MSATVSPNPPHAFPLRAFLITCLVVSLWVNASEVFRYFVFIMPMMRETLAGVPDVAPMSFPIFMVWGVWDTILVLMTVVFYWLYAERFGASRASAVIAGTLAWAFFFLLFWIAMLNMNLAVPGMAAVALPLAWIELVIACLIAREGFRRFG
jgi:hypothetical protein